MGREIEYYCSYYTNIADGGHLLNPGEVEDSFDCEPDEMDVEEGTTAVDMAVDVLKEQAYTPTASSTDFGRHTWYMGEPEEVDPLDYEGDGPEREGAERLEHTSRLVGFSEDEEREIFERMTAG